MLKIASGGEHGMSRTQVLVIERDPAQHSFIVESLAGKFSTSSAYDESEGLEKSAQLQPVLVLLAGSMALKGSYVEKLRKVSNSINLPILILISAKERASKDRLLSGIAQDFLVMPFSKEELLVRVDNLLSLTRFRESYETVFNSMDQAFCIIEVIFDANNKPVDYVFLEVNNAFQQHTGFQDAVGKRIRELVPAHDQHWFDIYGKVATTGESVRLEDRAEQMGRWYNVYAFRVGAPAEPKLPYSSATSRNKRKFSRRLTSKIGVKPGLLR
jgi:CheY-like chemotaxis protein